MLHLRKSLPLKILLLCGFWYGLQASHSGCPDKSPRPRLHYLTSVMLHFLALLHHELVA